MTLEESWMALSEVVWLTRPLWVRLLTIEEQRLWYTETLRALAREIVR